MTDEDRDDPHADMFEGLTDDEVAAKARLFWLAEQEEQADGDDIPPVYDDRYDWNP